jgi:hypothetical protein
MNWDGGSIIFHFFSPAEIYHRTALSKQGNKNFTNLQTETRKGFQKLFPHRPPPHALAEPETGIYRVLSRAPLLLKRQLQFPNPTQKPSAAISLSRNPRSPTEIADFRNPSRSSAGRRAADVRRSRLGSRAMRRGGVALSGGNASPNA